MKSDSSSSFPANSEGIAPDSTGTGPRSTESPSQDGLDRLEALEAGTDSRPKPQTLATLDFALLRGALEEIPFGVATTRGGSILYANEALARIFGASHGGLENLQVSQLFPEETYARISQRLEEVRVFDGRITTRGLDGRIIDAEVHIEWYSSEAQGVGGFLVLRDVSLELGALGRLVDQLGGGLFRVRVVDATIELISPTITRLTGVDAATCAQHPVVLTQLLSAEERERLAFLYRRMSRGELSTVSAQVSLRRHDGVVRVLQIRATCRRDTTGVVRHIDGVVYDAARDTEGYVHESSSPPSLDQAVSRSRAAHDEGRSRPRLDLSHNAGSGSRTEGVAMGALSPGHRTEGSRDILAHAAMELSHELLREGSQALHTLTRELRGVRTGIKNNAAALSPAVAEELTARIESAAAVVAGAVALNRSVRRVLTTPATMGAPLGEVLENVRATLAPVLGGDRLLTIDPGDAANIVIPERVEELGAALVYLSLRAFRFAGSGSLRVVARRTDPPEEHRIRTRLSRPPPERSHVVIELLGEAPADMADTSVEISSDMLRTVPRPAEADAAYQAAHALIAAVGGSIESDDATFSTARSVIRLRT